MAGEATCMACHGIQYANILPSWQEEMDRRLTVVDGIVNGAQASLGSVSVRQRAAADSLIRLARENTDLVRTGRSAHNIAFADELLRAAVDLVNQAVTAGMLPFRIPEAHLGPRLSENICLQCHLGVERQSVEFHGRQFAHERHVVAGLACTVCHTPLDEHGETTLSGSGSCDACHHSRIEPMNCARCHDGPGGAPARVFEHVVGDFSHDVHRTADLACTECHQSPALRPAETLCETCHNRHHQPEATCLSCHRGGAKAYHALSFAHLPCTGCHGENVSGVTEWSRQVCTVCHNDRVEHNAPANCILCHDITPISG
jgi:hypothetical protein